MPLPMVSMINTFTNGYYGEYFYQWLLWHIHLPTATESYG